ncbi:multi antimicrobial extrusion protein [Tanacetum coccineum]
MLGIYLQRSWIVLHTAALALTFTYIFGASILRILGQTPAIATAAGAFAIWMIPQLFAYATVLPIAKFLQAQSNIMPMAYIASVAVVSHVFLSWLLMLKLGWGLAGAAVVLDGSWWFITLAQITYVLWGSCGEAWSGFSWKAFSNLKGFLHISFTTALLFSLETLYFMSLFSLRVLFEKTKASGRGIIISLGLNVAVSVRVSNELGYGRPRAARFSVIVVVLTSLLIGLLSTTVLVVYKKQYPVYFTSSPEVMQLIEELTLLLGISIIIRSAQYALFGVAIGAGWQTVVAYMNTGSYVIVGIPIGLLLGFKYDMGVKGIWYGMVSGMSTQCFLLLIMLSRTNWNDEVQSKLYALTFLIRENESTVNIELKLWSRNKMQANAAEDRIKHWGGDIRNKEDEERIVY